MGSFVSLPTSGASFPSETEGDTTTRWLATASDLRLEWQRALESIATGSSWSRVFGFDVLIREEQSAHEISMYSVPAAALIQAVRGNAGIGLARSPARSSRRMSKSNG